MCTATGTNNHHQQLAQKAFRRGITFAIIYGNPRYQSFVISTSIEQHLGDYSVKFGGLFPCSLIDFPGRLAMVLFTQGCSFRCPFCHNPDLVLPHRFTKNLISEEDVFSLLKKREKKLDGVTISGGEPTLQEGLEPFIKKIQDLGFAVKLDTNGTNPSVVETLLQKQLINYVAMDIKASLAKYKELAGVPVDTSLIEKSIHLLMSSDIPYEFRTTIIKELHNEQEVVAMASMIPHAKKYVLQKFRPGVTIDTFFQKYSAYSDAEMTHLCSLAAPFVKECFYR